MNGVLVDYRKVDPSNMAYARHALVFGTLDFYRPSVFMVAWDEQLASGK
jgi:hypothetical protein